MDLALLCLFTVIYFDTAFFKRRDRRLFGEIFQFSPPKTALSLLLILAVLVFSGDRWADLPPLILLFFFPAYLLRRSRFAESIKRDDECKTPELLSGALGVIILWTYGAVVFGFFASGVMDLFPGTISEMGELIISAVFSSALIMGLVYQSSKHFSGRGFLENVGLRRGGRSWVVVILIPVILGLFFAFFSSYVAVSRQIQPQTPLAEVLETTQSLGLIMAFLFLAVCVAPLIEEIVFRGYFFHVIKEWIGAKKSIYIIALTFAVLHVGQYWGDWLAIAMVTTLGFTLTILRAWTGTTIASVVTHYVYNGGVTIIPIIMLAISNPAYFEYKAYYPSHDVQTKEALLKKSIARQPDLADAYNDLAWLYAQEEIKLEEALEFVDQALKFAPEHSAYLDTKAEILEKLGRLDEAESIRKRLKGKLP